MNRIAGVVNFDQNPVAPAELDRMLGVLKFQEQDRQDAWIKGGVGLGCTQFGRSQTEPAEDLLFHSPNSRRNITFDGRLDNRRDLLAHLRTRPHALAADQEIVLAAYEKWGLDFPKHLIGDFALAIWDEGEQYLVCARDHFGVKPLYYHFSDQLFLFASTPQAILASRKVSPIINEERIADHLVNPLEGVDKTSSFYRDIFRLPPAHIMIVRPGKFAVSRYWELDPAVRSDLRTDEELIDAFEELFREAVRCRLDGAVPASMFSGGMDSSSIVGMGRKVLAGEGGQPLQVFAAISDSPDVNRETSYISSVLDQGNLVPHLISETGLLERMDEVVRAIETEAEPFDCLMNLNRMVYLHAHGHGINALLDGIDGDILLSGSGHLAQLWHEAALSTIIDETFRSEGVTAEYKMGRGLFLNSFLSAFLPVAPDWLRALRKPFRYNKVLRSAIRESIIDREFAVRTRLVERFSRLDVHSPSPRSFRQIESHKIVLDHPFLTVGLERYERVSSAFGIEARHPFADVRLAEFCLALPWHLKTRRGWTKFILRRAMEPCLPPEVVWRRDKDSLMWEFNRLILRERADYFHQVTLDERESLKPYVNLQKLGKYWNAYLTRGDEKHADLLWLGIALAFWLRRQRSMESVLAARVGAVN